MSLQRNSRRGFHGADVATIPMESVSTLPKSLSPCYTASMKITLNTILAGLCILIVLAIIVGTAIFFGTKKAQPSVDLRRPEPAPTTQEQIIQAQKTQQQTQGEASQTSGEFGTYTSLGQVRASTMPDPETATTALVLVEPWFSYTSDDPAFQEELDTKRQKIHSIFLQFFSNHSYQQLRAMGEELVKSQLQESINKELVLGSISAVYFESYLFFE